MVADRLHEERERRQPAAQDALGGNVPSITTISSSPASRRPSEMIAARVVLVSMVAIRIPPSYAVRSQMASGGQVNSGAVEG